MRHALVIALASFLVVSCGPNSNLYEVLTPQTPPEPAAPLGLSLVPYLVGLEASFPQHEQRTKADVVLAIENSATIKARLDIVERDIGALLSKLNSRAIAFRMGIIKAVEDDANGTYRSAFFGSTPWIESTDLDGESKIKTNIRQLKISYEGGNERPTWSNLEAYHNSANSGFFRPDAAMIYVTVSDSIDDLLKPKDYSDAFVHFGRHAGTRSWMMSRIGSPESNPCDDAEFRTDLLGENLSLYSGGKIYRFCDLNYAAHFEDIAQSIASHLTETSLTPYIPWNHGIDAENMLVRVAGNVIPNNPTSGFQWNQYKQAISFPGSFVPSPGQTVEVYLEYVEP